MKSTRLHGACTGIVAWFFTSMDILAPPFASRCQDIYNIPGGANGGTSDIRRFVTEGGRNPEGSPQSDLRYVLSLAPVPGTPQHAHSHTPSLAVIVMCPLSEHGPALSCRLEFPSTARKAPVLSSLVARAHIRQAILQEDMLKSGS